jgi:hypothetical protein
MSKLYFGDRVAVLNVFLLQYQGVLILVEMDVTTGRGVATGGRAGPCPPNATVTLYILC